MVTTNGTDIVVADVMANAAIANVMLQVYQCVGKSINFFHIPTQQVECQPQCGLASNSWQFRQLLYCLFKEG